jgi:exosome complex component RRP45
MISASSGARGTSSLPPYVPLKESESSARYLSMNELNFLRNTLCYTQEATGNGVLQNPYLRMDGRRLDQAQSFQLQFLRWENGASCTVACGGGSGLSRTHTGRTRVTCRCVGEILSPPPNLERPSEGSVAVSVELSPAASLSYRPTATISSATSNAMGAGSIASLDDHQKTQSVRLVRTIERVLADVLDKEALCIVPGQFVWSIRLHVTVLDNTGGGNLVDASVTAAVAALRHYRQPIVETNDTGSSSASSASSFPQIIPSHLKEPSPLPLHHTPLSVTLGVIHHQQPLTHPNAIHEAPSSVSFLVDPDPREELVVSGLLTVAGNVHGEICLFDYRYTAMMKQSASGGNTSSGSVTNTNEANVGHSLTLPRLVRDGGRRAIALIQSRCNTLEKALQEADEKASTELLQRYRQQVSSSEPSSLLSLKGIFDQDEPMTDDMGSAQVTSTPLQDDSAVDEAYRRRALDYSIGHVAHKVREDANEKPLPLPPKPPSVEQQASQLLAAMLQSIQASSEASTAEPTAILDSASATPGKDSQSNEFDLTKRQDPVAEQPLPAPTSADITPEPLIPNAAMRLDSDEEETTTQLQSEFTNSSATTGTAHHRAPSTSNDEIVRADDAGDDEIDLAAAIKKKKGAKKPKPKG